jgi:predicted nucleotidyltransferase
MGTELDSGVNGDTTSVPEASGRATQPQAYTDSPGALAALRTRLPWLDQGIAELLVGVAADLAHMHPEVRALILFGSLARHEERPLGVSRPSDVDLLVLLRPIAGATKARVRLEDKLGLYHTIGEREYRHAALARGLEVVLADERLADWDERFIENVARDGVLLWTRGPLPAVLTSVAARGTVLDVPTSPA